MDILDPREAWQDKEAYDRKGWELKARFEKNFELYKGAPPELAKA